MGNYQLMTTRLQKFVPMTSAAMRVEGVIPARNKYLYSLYLLVPSQTVCVYDISIIVNAPYINNFKFNNFSFGAMFLIFY